MEVLMKLSQNIQVAVVKHDAKKLKDFLKTNSPEEVTEALLEVDNFGSSAMSYMLRTGDKEILNTFIENFLAPKSKAHINGSSPELEIALRVTGLDTYDIQKCLETVYDSDDVGVLLGQINFEVF